MHCNIMQCEPVYESSICSEPWLQIEVPTPGQKTSNKNKEQIFWAENNKTGRKKHRA